MLPNNDYIPISGLPKTSFANTNCSLTSETVSFAEFIIKEDNIKVFGEETSKVAEQEEKKDAIHAKIEESRSIPSIITSIGKL